MADDIVEHIRATWITDRISTHYETCWQHHTECAIRVLLDEIERLRQEVDLKGSRLDDALDEIERLRAALALAVGELSTHGEYTAWTPEMLMNQFLEEARRV